MAVHGKNDEASMGNSEVDMNKPNSSSMKVGKVDGGQPKGTK